MKKNRIILIMIINMMFTYSCMNSGKPNPEPVKTSSPQAAIARGKYLVDIIGCSHCHTPTIMTPAGPVKDTARLFGGHPSAFQLPPINPALSSSWILSSPVATATAGPWGITYAANISADGAGIGNWTEQQFLRALREGKAKGLPNGRNLLPPMPWESYRNLTDEDAKAIFAYLKTTRPVANVVPPPQNISKH